MRLEDIEKNNFTSSEKFLAGCEAISGKPVKDIAEKNGMSRGYVYQQKAEVKSYIERLDEETAETPKIEFTKELRKKAILSLALDGHATLEGIQRFFESIFGIHISIGYISWVIKEACERAQKFDDNISLEGIHQGANDEIFQGSTPVLTGIDPESTYVYLLEESKDRTADTWEVYMQDRKEHGLNLEVTINDGGAGLMAGIPRAFKDIEINLDVFHALQPIGKEVSKMERKTYALINQEYELAKRMQGIRPQQKTKEKFEQIRPKVRESIVISDTFIILFGWLKELLGFSGYDMNDTVALIEFVLREMEQIAGAHPSLLKEIEKFRRNLPLILSYINRLYKAMDRCAVQHGIPPDAFYMMYKQLSYELDSEAYQEIEYQLVMLLMYGYGPARELFKQIIRSTKKASSLVENLNSRIRVYMNIKRIAPTKFFVLMKVYFNTRRYRRSRCKERIGKSPLELLTGRKQPEFLEALGY